MAAKEPIAPPPDIDLAEALPDDPVLEALEWTIDNTILTDELIAKCGDDTNLLLAVYGRMEDAIQELRKAQDAVGRAAMPLVPKYQPMPVPGGGTFKIGGGKEKKSYDNERLVSTAAHRMMTEMKIEKIVTAEGEVGEAEPIFSIVAKKIAQFAGATVPSFNSWRSGIAKELGIKLDDYCEVTTGDLTHRIEARRPPTDHAADAPAAAS